MAAHPLRLILPDLATCYCAGPLAAHRPLMNRPPSNAKPSRFRALIASVLFCSVAFAIGLSAAPQLHDALHKSDGTTHQCAATLLSSGSYEHGVPAPVLAAPQPAPQTFCFVDAVMRVAARPRTSILEHAPPALS